jgi:hypothetical protein
VQDPEFIPIPAAKKKRKKKYGKKMKEYLLP